MLFGPSMRHDNDNDPFQRIGLATALILNRLRNEIRIQEYGSEQDQANERQDAEEEALRRKLKSVQRI